MLQSYETPPIPHAYEICYAYALGKPLEVLDLVNRAVDEDGILSLYKVLEIHSTLFSYPETIRKQQEETASGLSSELSTMIVEVSAHLSANDTFADSLGEVSQELSKVTDPASLGRMIVLLMAECAKARENAKQLSDNLEVSLSAIRQISDKLEEAQEAGLRDALTSLRNRRFFDRALREEVTLAHETGSPLSLVMTDIDHFKAINDTHGHPAGDAVLRAVGRLLAANVKGRDTPARYGGEEFAIVLPQTRSVGAADLSERIRRELSGKRLVLTESQTKLGKITASFGVAQLRENETAEELISRCDHCLYTAKRNGRNRVVTEED
ncbi:MAG: GGDEF domain-containing protein [Pseudomonadota bacterium]